MSSSLIFLLEPSAGEAGEALLSPTQPTGFAMLGFWSLGLEGRALSLSEHDQ